MNNLPDKPSRSNEELQDGSGALLLFALAFVLAFLFVEVIR